VPLCKLVAEAGWEPITAARSSDSHVHLERFGRYLTVFNDSKARRTATITLEEKVSAPSRELVGSGMVPWTENRTVLTLDAECVAVIELPSN
jgi:hypothetical protein